MTFPLKRTYNPVNKKKEGRTRLVVECLINRRNKNKTEEIAKIKIILNTILLKLMDAVHSSIAFKENHTHTHKNKHNTKEKHSK